MNELLLAAALAAAGTTAPRLDASGARVSRRPANEAATVRAVWRQGSYDGPRRRYDCVPALHAVAAALDAVEARSVSRGCSGSRGVYATWSALTPVKDGETPREPVVEASWVHAQLQFSLSDPRGCSDFAETFEHMLDVLSVRNVNLSVFCQPGRSFISASFDYPALH